MRLHRAISTLAAGKAERELVDMQAADGRPLTRQDALND